MSKKMSMTLADFERWIAMLYGFGVPQESVIKDVHTKALSGEIISATVEHAGNRFTGTHKDKDGQ